MVTTILAYLNAAIVAAIGLIHFYWAFGGRWGIDQALPATDQGKKVLIPGMIACLVVAFGLMAFSLYYLMVRTGGFTYLPVALFRWGAPILAGIFLLRALGDFKYVGLFKQVKTTVFASMDTQYYTPLCLYLGTSTAWIALENLGILTK